MLICMLLNQLFDSAHGLGTAALSAKEPEALPFCAIAYALNGIFGSVLCSIPVVRQSLLALVGWTSGAILIPITANIIAYLMAAQKNCTEQY